MVVARLATARRTGVRFPPAPLVATHPRICHLTRACSDIVWIPFGSIRSRVAIRVATTTTYHQGVQHACGLVIEVNQQLELHDRAGIGAVGPPAPHALAVGFELGVAERLFEPGRVDGATGDLEVDLDVNVGRARVLVVTGGAEQLRDEAAEHDGLGSCPVVVDDPDQGALSSASSCPAARRVIGHRRPPGGAPPLPPREPPRREGRHRPAARARHVGRRQSPQADRPLRSGTDAE